MNEFVQIPVSKEEINRERREDIIQLARETAELCELSHDINELIGEATPMLLEIEKDTEVALENVCQAKDNVINAQISQSSSNKKKIIIVGLITTIGIASGGSLGAIAGTYLVGKAIVGGIIGMASLGSVFGTSSILLTK